MRPEQKPNTFPPPTLLTLDQPPSWHNARGRLDRSACIEIRISEVRRIAGCVVPNGRRRPDGKGRTQLVTPLPHERRARNGQGRIATGVFTITAHFVNQLHFKRKPRTLAGDHRTPRAPAMRPPTCDPDEPFRIRVEYNGPPAQFDQGLDANPNKGACRTKMIGLHEAWSQPLRIEKWEFKDRIRPAYYLICPGTFLHRSSLPYARVKEWLGLNDPILSPALHVPTSSSTDPRLPPLSTVKAGRKAVGCPQRALKLMLVQCTGEENTDAVTAQTWINALPPPARRAHEPFIQKLIARYGLIMEPRTLLCQRCLGAAYGNDPETVRQGWRRRQGKDNASPAKRAPRHT